AATYRRSSPGRRAMAVGWGRPSVTNSAASPWSGGRVVVVVVVAVVETMEDVEGYGAVTVVLGSRTPTVAVVEGGGSVDDGAAVAQAAMTPITTTPSARLIP